MSMQYKPPSLIGATNTTVANPFLPPIPFARAAGPIMNYDYQSLKPRKRVKEMLKILWPEKKSFLKLPYGFKFNLSDRCVVCGSQKVWEMSDPMRPGIPLHKVRKGYPMRGTYCDKHAGLYKQYEMLEQQILAEEHGLEFSQYIPRPRVPKILNPLAAKEPMTSLTQADIQSLAGVGWTIRPPMMSEETKEDELFRLVIETDSINSRIKELVKQGTKVIDKEGEQ